MKQEEKQTNAASNSCHTHTCKKKKKEESKKRNQRCLSAAFTACGDHQTVQG
jgi:hypothetical protein